MTIKQMIDEVQTVFPTVGRNQIRLDIDTAQKEFARKTRILGKRGELSSPSSNLAWELPSDFESLTDVRIYDSSGYPLILYNKEIDYDCDPKLGKIFFKSITTTNITGLPSAIDKAYIYYDYKPATISSESASLEIDEQYYEALKAWIYKKYFKLYPTEIMTNNGVIRARDARASSTFEADWQRYIKDAKRFSKDSTVKDVQHYQHAGKVSLPMRDDSGDSATITSSLTAISALYEKYAYYTLVPPGDTSEKTAYSYGYSGVTATLASNGDGTYDLTFTSSGQFGEDTFIEVAGCDIVSVTRTSSSLITVVLIDFQGSTGAVEIYEK